MAICIHSVVSYHRLDTLHDTHIYSNTNDRVWRHSFAFWYLVIVVFVGGDCSGGEEQQEVESGRECRSSHVCRPRQDACFEYRKEIGARISMIQG